MMSKHHNVSWNRQMWLHFIVTSQTIPIVLVRWVIYLTSPYIIFLGHIIVFLNIYIHLVIEQTASINTIWKLIHLQYFKLEMYLSCSHLNLKITNWKQIIEKFFNPFTLVVTYFSGNMFRDLWTKLGQVQVWCMVPEA